MGRKWVEKKRKIFLVIFSKQIAARCGKWRTNTTTRRSNRIETDRATNSPNSVRPITLPTHFTMFPSLFQFPPPIHIGRLHASIRTIDRLITRVWAALLIHKHRPRAPNRSLEWHEWRGFHGFVTREREGKKIATEKRKPDMMSGVPWRHERPHNV